MANTLDNKTLYPPGFNNKAIMGWPELKGQMELGTQAIPVKAAKRKQGEKPALSFAMAMGTIKLLTTGELASGRFVGSDTDTMPSGVMVTTKDKKFNLWCVARKQGGGATKTLQLCGEPFGNPMFSYYGGLVIAAYMMLNHRDYPDFVAAVRQAVAPANQDRTTQVQNVARIADEMAYAVENMIAGKDPTGINRIETMRDAPTDLNGQFKGGEVLKEAFESPAGIDKMLKTKVQATTIESVLLGSGPVKTDYVGDLPLVVRDLIMRGKHPLLTGPTATGKTKAVDDVVLDIVAPMSELTGSEGIEDRDMIGSWVRQTDGSLKFAYGPLSQSIIRGRQQYMKWEKEQADAKAAGRDPVPVPPSVFKCDEINRLQPRHQNILIAAMNEHPTKSGLKVHTLWVPETNEMLSCPVGFWVCVGARNYGGSYVGTNEMDQALERRFYAKIDVGYLEVAEETKLIQRRTGLEERICRVITRCAKDTRSQLTQLKAPLDTDSVLKWGEQLAYLQSKGIKITDKIVMESAKQIVFDVVLERTERGEFDPSGLQILQDNINESWREVFKT